MGARIEQTKAALVCGRLARRIGVFVLAACLAILVTPATSRACVVPTVFTVLLRDRPTDVKRADTVLRVEVRDVIDTTAEWRDGTSSARARVLDADAVVLETIQGDVPLGPLRLRYVKNSCLALFRPGQGFVTGRMWKDGIFFVDPHQLRW